MERVEREKRSRGGEEGRERSFTRWPGRGGRRRGDSCGVDWRGGGGPVSCLPPPPLLAQAEFLYYIELLLGV